MANKKKKIAVIGAGPSGLAQLRAFQSAADKGEDIPEIVCFEKQQDWGGLWNYSWRTGVDEYGDPVHGSMYYSFEEHFGKQIASYPPRAVLFDYIKGRVEKAGVRSWIRFNTVVSRVEFNDSNKTFTVRDRFNGRVLHAHDFRDAVEFKDKRVLIVGTSYSAEDIGSQCWKYGAKSITVSHRTAPIGYSWPDNWKEVPLLTRVEANTVHFKDGSSEDIDAIVCCVYKKP